MDEHEDHERHDARWFTWAGVVVAGVLAFSLAVGLVILPIAQAPNAGIDAWTAICRAIGIAPGTPAQPQPPFNAGRPELARPEVLERYNALLAPRMARSRAEATALGGVEADVEHRGRVGEGAH